MTYNWNDAANSEGGESGPKIDPGYCKAKIVKVIRGKKDGTLFTSKNDDPQLMVVWENDDGEQAPTMFTLSQKAGFVLAKACARMGMNLNRMTEGGITPDSFANEDFATKQLMGRECWIHVEEYGNNGKVSATACDESEVPPQYLKQSAEPVAAGNHETLTEDDIPF